MANVTPVTSRQFDAEVTGSTLPVVVDFYAPWCGPCHLLAPVMDALADHFDGQVRFVKVNVDEEPSLAERYNIRGVPTLLLFSGGAPVERIVGLVPPDTLHATIRELAHSPTATARA